jgi:triacylglycerol esterase/lipase EstA (alpha/beta hydrolase family)
MGHRLQITVSSQQYAFLDEEANRSSVSMAELVRRALDTVFAPQGQQKILVISHSVGRRSGRHIE